MHETHDTTTSDFPIEKFPISKRVDPLTIGDQGFVLHVNRARVNRELPKRDFPISERKIVEGVLAVGRRTPERS